MLRLVILFGAHLATMFVIHGALPSLFIPVPSCGSDRHPDPPRAESTAVLHEQQYSVKPVPQCV